MPAKQALLIRASDENGTQCMWTKTETTLDERPIGPILLELAPATQLPNRYLLFAFKVSHQNGRINPIHHT